MPESLGDDARARRAQMTDRLAAAADTLLTAGVSYSELRVEDLLIASNISRATFYAYFDDKVDLLRSWFAGVGADVLSAVARWTDVAPPVTFDALTDVITGIVESYRPGSPMLLAVFKAGDYDQRVGEDLRRVLHTWITGLTGHIERGQSGGWIATDISAPDTAGWLVTMATRGQYRLISAANAAHHRRLIDSFVTIVWKTLYHQR